jgi:hypothetical protein
MPVLAAASVADAAFAPQITEDDASGSQEE